MNTIKFYRPDYRHYNYSRMNQNCQSFEYKPKTNIIEEDNNYLVEMMVPGIKKDDLNIELEKDALIVSYEAKEESNDVKYKVQEFELKSFRKKFVLSDKLDTANIKAEIMDGILQINIPKKEEATIKKMIEIS